MLDKIKGALFKKKQQPLSNTEKIDGYRKQIGSALGLFNSLRNELHEVNEGLSEIVASSEAEIEKLQQDIVNAKAEINENTGLISKVEGFIK